MPEPTEINVKDLPDLLGRRPEQIRRTIDDAIAELETVDARIDPTLRGIREVMRRLELDAS